MLSDHVGKTATYVGQVQDAAVCHGEQQLGRTSLTCLLKCIAFAQPKHTCTMSYQLTCHQGCHPSSTPVSPQLPATRHVASAWSQASRSASNPLWCHCSGHHWEFDESYGKHRARRLEGGDHASCLRGSQLVLHWLDWWGCRDVFQGMGNLWYLWIKHGNAVERNMPYKSPTVHCALMKIRMMIAHCIAEGQVAWWTWGSKCNRVLNCSFFKSTRGSEWERFGVFHS